MKADTGTLAEAALDWAVATAEGREADALYTLKGPPTGVRWYSPATNATQAGVIMLREKIGTRPVTTPAGQDVWRATIKGADGHVAFEADGVTPWQAAMRCFLLMRLGPQIELPIELSATSAAQAPAAPIRRGMTP